MEWHSIEFWGIVLDIIGLCLLGTVIIYLIRNKAAYRHNLMAQPEKTEAYSSTEFHEALLKSLAQSQTAFETVSEALKKERKFLEQVISRDGRTPMKLADDHKPDNQERVDDKYEKVLPLMRSGLTTEQISQQLDISRNEVELLIKLNR